MAKNQPFFILAGDDGMLWTETNGMEKLEFSVCCAKLATY